MHDSRCLESEPPPGKVLYRVRGGIGWPRLNDQDPSGIRPGERWRGSICEPGSVDGSRPRLLPEAEVDLAQLFVQTLHFIFSLPGREPWRSEVVIGVTVLVTAWQSQRVRGTQLTSDQGSCQSYELCDPYDVYTKRRRTEFS